MADSPKLDELIDHLIHNLKHPWPAGVNLEYEQYLHDGVLDSHCHGAIKILDEYKMKPDSLERVLDEYPARCGSSLDAKDAVVDVIRVTARECGLRATYERATNEYLRLLTEEMQILNHRGECDKAQRAFRRGEHYWEEADFEVDRVAQAGLFEQFACTWLLRSNRHPKVEGVLRVVTAAEFLIRAADLLVITDAFEDYCRVCNTTANVSRSLHQAAMEFRPEFGAATVLPWLRYAANGFEKARCWQEFARASLDLSTALSEARDAEAAEHSARKALDLAGDELADDLSIPLRVQLTQSLSEQARYEESIKQQQQLLKEMPREPEYAFTVGVLNLGIGNCFSKTGKPADAELHYQQALDVLDQSLTEDARNLIAQIHVVSAEARFKLSDQEGAIASLRKASVHFAEQGSGVSLLQYQSRAGKLLYMMKKWHQSDRYLAQAEETLKQVLRDNWESSTWESMLQEWYELPASRVEIALRYCATPARRKTALISAETAKGRLLDLTRYRGLPDAQKVALSPERRGQAIERIRQWCDRKSGRYVLSLFGTDNGLAIWVLGTKKAFPAIWIEQMQYQVFMRELYEPWERLMEASGSDEAMSNWAGTVTELLLAKLGEWLWRACPKLAKGGSDIVMSPHRLFRSLPLHQCELPGGFRLGDVFTRVIIIPTLTDFDESLTRKTTVKKDSWTAAVLADPTGDLPLSRLDGSSLDKDSIVVGADVTSTATLQALTNHDLVVISCHGDFDEVSPWRSFLRLVDGEMSLGRLLKYADQHRLRAKVVVLGACETGKSRRSLSDEAVGFPGLLIHAGVEVVLAPLWQVNDLASSLYVNEFVRRVMQSYDPIKANMQAARWMQELTVQDARVLLESQLNMLNRLSENGEERFRPAQIIIEQDLHWLKYRPEDDRLFSSREWAAFQLVGVGQSHRTVETQIKEIYEP